VSAVLPLELERDGRGVRRLSFMGAGEVSPNHLDLVAAPHARPDPALAAAFCGHLLRHRRRWDVLDLVSVADDAALRAPAWLNCFRSHGCDVRVSLYTRCAHAALPATFDGFLERLGAHTRAEFRRKRRKLLRDVPDARFGVVRDDAGLARVFDAMVRLHQARWTRLGEAGAFSDARFTDFHRAAAGDALARGQLRLYYLEAGGTVVATYYCYRVGPRVFYYAGGFDEAWGKHSVGIQALAHSIEQSVAEGAADFDFLQGDEEYKSHWSTGRRDNWRVTVAAPHLRGRLIAGAGATRARLHDWWRAHVPLETRRKVKRLLRRP
jgi:CelD/BcsL family acetyltransferase involved in cellulose biosynthesis